MTDPSTVIARLARTPPPSSTMSEKDTYEPSPKALEELALGHVANTTRTSIDTVADSETQRENVRSSNPNGFVGTNNGINVKAAEAEFAELQRELSGISQQSRHLSRTQSRQSRKGRVNGEKDVERATSSEETEDEPFDLESTLRGNQAAEIASGIRPKHIGVVWENLTVSGTGGVTNFVKTFPDAFLSFFNVYVSCRI